MMDVDELLLAIGERVSIGEGRAIITVGASFN